MAHLTRTRADLAAWLSILAVTAAEFDALDQKGFVSINGDQGGSWAPSSVIIIGGMGLDVLGPCSLYDLTNAVLSGSLVAIAGSNIDIEEAVLNVNSDGFIKVNSNGFLTIENGGDLLVKNGGDVIVQSGGEIRIESGGVINVNGANGLVLLGSATVFCTTGSEIYGTLTLAANVTRTGKDTKSGSGGRTAWRVQTITPDAGAFLDVSFDVYIYVHSLASAVTHSLRLGAPGLVPTIGEIQRFHVTNTGGGNITFKNDGAGVTILTHGGAAAHVRVSFIFDGTKWRFLDGFASAGTFTMGADA